MTRCGIFERLTPIIGLSLTLYGCRRSQPPPPESTLARGDTVVVETRAGEFFEGRVLDVESPKVKIQTLSSDDLLEVGVGDVYRVSGAALRKPAPAFGICNTKPGAWEGCRVEETNGARSRAVTWDGREQDLSNDKILMPSDVTELNLERRFELAKARGHFENQARLAGKPERPKGWRPTKHDQVLARRGDQWLSARVEQAADAGVGVLWEDQERVVTLSSNDVVPLPPYSPPAPVLAGSFALMEPELEGKDWISVKVESVTETEAVVVDGNGKESRVPLRKLVPLRSQ